MDIPYDDQIANLKGMINLPFGMNLIILIAWAIWNTRNDFIFKGIPPNLYACRRRFKEELKWLVHRANRNSYAALPDWVQTFR